MTFSTLGLHTGQTLVKDVSLTIKKGQVLALVGSSGAGKSLSCSTLLGVLPSGIKQFSGKVLIDEQEADPVKVRGKVITSIMQNPRSAFNPLYNMQAHILKTAMAVNKKLTFPMILDLLQEVGIEDGLRVSKLYPFDMSGGMLQRMMIAIALNW